MVIALLKPMTFFVEILLLCVFSKEVIVEALCDASFNACGHYLDVRPFDCRKAADVACGPYCSAGNYITRADNACCMLMASLAPGIPAAIIASTLVDRSSVTGSGEAICCCDPTSQPYSPVTNDGNENLDGDGETTVPLSTPADEDGETNVPLLPPAHENGEATVPLPPPDDGGNNNDETSITAEDERKCKPPILKPFGNCVDYECNWECHDKGIEGRHVCLNDYKCCCNYDEVRDLTSVYDPST